MPLHGAPVGVLVRLLAIQRAAVVADAAGAEREEDDGPPIPQPLLHRLLPDLPHQYRLHNPAKSGKSSVGTKLNPKWEGENQELQSNLVDARIEAVLERAGGVGRARAVRRLLTILVRAGLVVLVLRVGLRIGSVERRGRGTGRRGGGEGAESG